MSIKKDIPKPTGEKKLVKKNGNTNDIIESMLRLDSFFDPEFCKFSQQFAADASRGDTSGLKKLWHFVKYEIDYKKDPDGKSIQGTPPATWKLGTGDCKNKTLFVNAVLRCLRIPYIIRFTNYERGKANVSHVYTVAILGDKLIPIDTVWDYFNSEKAYNKKIDYDMTDIIEISGINTEIARREKPAHYVPQDLKNCNFSFPVTENAMKLAEIKQKQAYVLEPDMIAFSKLNEAQAALQIIERELSIISIMCPEKAKIALQGIEMIRKTKGKDFCITGSVPVELNNVAAKIRNLEKMQQYSATGWGILGKRIREGKQRINENRVAAFPERICLNNLWYHRKLRAVGGGALMTSYNWEFDPFVYSQMGGGTSNNGNCYTHIQNIKDWMFNVSHNDFSPNQGYGAMPLPKPNILNKDSWMFFYGRNTEYAVTYREFGELYYNTLIAKMVTDGLASGRGLNVFPGGASLIFNNDVNYNTALDMLKSRCGVFDKFINDIYSANAANNPDGTIGSGLLYSFSGGITYQGQTISMNSLPPSVIAKLTHQNSFLDASNAYSGISRTNIKGLARNGVLFDNGGKQPELTLRELYTIYTNPASINCPVCPIIAAIVAAVLAIIAAIAAAVEKGQKAEDQSRNIDTALSDTARLSALGPSLMPEQNDFMPNTTGLGGNTNTGGGGNTNTGGGNNNTGGGGSSGMLIGAAALAALAIYKKNKK